MTFQKQTDVGMLCCSVPNDNEKNHKEIEPN